MAKVSKTCFKGQPWSPQDSSHYICFFWRWAWPSCSLLRKHRISSRPQRLSKWVGVKSLFLTFSGSELSFWYAHGRGRSCRNCLTIWKYNFSPQALLPLKQPWLHRRLPFVSWSRPWQMRMNPSEKPPPKCWQSSRPQKEGVSPRAPNHEQGVKSLFLTFSGSDLSFWYTHLLA
jgi:hypothetical protein